MAKVLATLTTRPAYSKGGPTQETLAQSRALMNGVSRKHFGTEWVGHQQFRPGSAQANLKAGIERADALIPAGAKGFYTGTSPRDFSFRREGANFVFHSGGVGSTTHLVISPATMTVIDKSTHSFASSPLLLHSSAPGPVGAERIEALVATLATANSSNVRAQVEPKLMPGQQPVEPPGYLGIRRSALSLLKYASPSEAIGMRADVKEITASTIARLGVEAEADVVSWATRYDAKRKRAGQTLLFDKLYYDQHKVDAVRSMFVEARVTEMLASKGVFGDAASTQLAAAKAFASSVSRWYSHVQRGVTF